AGGSTSTVSKTGLVELLGFAWESGAVSPAIAQNVVTLRANADGLVRFASNQEIFPACGPSDPDCAAPGPLKDLELSASFNVSDAGTKTFNGTVLPQAAASISLRYSNVARLPARQSGMPWITIGTCAPGSTARIG